MRKIEILEILNDWNFWKKELDTGIKRKSYLKKSQDILETNMILSLIGVRRSGKSFIMRQIVKDLIEPGMKPANTLMINFEDRRFSEITIKLLDKIYETYLEYLDPDDKIFVFLDEIHRVERWERWVRTMHELKKCKIIITGSTAELLQGELATVLTGRHLDIFVYPLSFKEFLNFKNLEIKDMLDFIDKKIEINRYLREYIEYGGFPEVVLSNNKIEILNVYFEDILNKDIIQRYNIRKISKLRNLAKFYLTNISSQITFNSLERSIGITMDTIEKFSGYLESALLIFFIKRFSFSIKTQDKSPRKVYGIDTGLCNAIGFRFTENKGRLIENLVALDLLRRTTEDPLLEIYYWKDNQGREVDFVIKSGLKVIELIQVCWDITNPMTKKREIRSLLKAMKVFELEQGMIITEDLEGEEKIQEKKIIYKTLSKWLLDME